MNIFQWMHGFMLVSLFDFRAVSAQDKSGFKDVVEKTHYASGIFLKDNVMDVLYPEMMMMHEPMPSDRPNFSCARGR
jgi:hypothetical protein